MKIIKDESLAILTRIFGHRGRYFLAASALLGFRLHAAGGLLTEEELWSGAANNLGRQEALDLGMPKPCGEVLVSGFCFPPGGAPAAATTTGFRVGGIEKKLVVIGDRFWIDMKNPRHTSPRPFTSMPLTWERAFGGRDYEPNPCGRGIGARKLKDGRSVFPLPNLEDPRHPVATPDDRPPPAGFSPLGMSWPGRLRGLGTFDERWLREGWPGFPEDFDFSYFNMAPRDQRQHDFFRGDERISTLHLTEKEAGLEAALPGLRARLFLMRKNDADRDWRETKSSLDTVWLFPSDGMGVVIWHGVWGISDDEGEDVAVVMAVLEPLGAPPGDAAGHEYRLVHAGDGKPQREKMDAAFPDETPEMQGTPSVAAAGVVTAGAAALTPAPAVFAGEAAAAPPPPELPPEFAGYAPLSGTPPSGATAEEMAAFYEIQTRKAQGHLEEYLRSIGIDPEAAASLPSAPAFPSAEEIIAAVTALPGDNRDLVTALKEMQAEQRAVETTTAALLDQGGEVPPAVAPAPPVTPRKGEEPPVADPGARIREIERRLAGSRDLSGMDLTGVEWRSFVLAGADLSGANLEGAMLAGHDLTGVNFSRALLSAIDLSGCVLAGAVMAGANASRAKMAGADLSGADLAGMDLNGADLRGADLTHADLTGADLSGANLSRVAGQHVRAAGALLIGADLSAADFGRGVFHAADFSAARMAGTVMTEADLREVWFSDADATGAALERTVMSGARAEGRTSFRNAGLSGADLRKTYFEDADFTAADFTAADLTGATLARCSLREACLSRSRAREADFSKADLTGADLQGMNLMEGSLRKANLHRADLRQANLFAVDFFKAALGDTRLEGANLNRTLLGGKIASGERG